jgi:hypothetical protein
MVDDRISEQGFLVLTALISGPRHGYGLLKEIEEISAGRVRLRTSTLYASLDRLARSGLIEESSSQIVDGRRGDPSVERNEIVTALTAAEVELRHELGPYEVVDLVLLGLRMRLRELDELVPWAARAVLAWGGLLSGLFLAIIVLIVPSGWDPFGLRRLRSSSPCPGRFPPASPCRTSSAKRSSLRAGRSRPVHFSLCWRR